MDYDYAIEAIAGQQAGLKKRSAPWMVGEQLKDILRREPGVAQLIAQDLTVGGLTLDGAEKKIKAFADKHKTGNFACVTPAEAETIIREYFGMPDAREEAPDETGKGGIDLADFF